MTVTSLVQIFLDSRRSYCAGPTVLFYQDNVQRFVVWLAAYNDCAADELQDIHLTKEAYRSYLLDLRAKGIRNVTVNTYIRAVRVFLRWIYVEEYVSADVTVNVKLPRMDNKFIFPLTSAEVAVVDSLFDTQDYLGLRNYCMFHLMLDAGFRSGEVVDLKWEHVMDNFVLVDNSKFNKSRSVPIPSWLHSSLMHLKELSFGQSDFVFLDRYCSDQVTSNTIKMLFYDLKTTAKIPRIHAHLLRHTFASSFVYYGGNLELLRVLMGHSSYDVTRNYLHIANQMLLSGYDMYKIDDLYFNLLGRR